VPEERGYQRQVAVSGPQRAVLADADAYGAGIGRAIEQGGEQMHQRQLRAYQVQRRMEADSEAADVARRSAEARLAIDGVVRASQTGPVPGAKGHAELVKKSLEEKRAELIDGIREDSVRNNAAAAWDDYASRTESNAQAYELGRGVKLDIENIGRAGELGENRVTSTGGDKDVYAQELTQAYASIDALENVTPEEKDALKRDREQGLTTAWLRARMGSDPASVKLELAAGAYDSLLSPEQISQLDRGADLEIKAAAVAAEAEASEARTAARNDVETFEAQLEAGNMPTAKDAAAVIARARAAGVPEADLIRLNTKYEDAVVLRAYDVANDPQGARSATTVEAINSKIRAGTATGPEVRLRDKLAGFADSRAKDAASALKDMAASGPAGQLQALGQISQLPSRQQRFTAAQQLGGNLGYIALLPSAASQQLAINGRSVLLARKKDFGEAIDVHDRFASQLGALAPSLGGSFDDMQSLTWQIYAGMMSANGETGWNKQRFDLATKVAFGATKRPDGTLQGGLATVRGRPTILPDNLTASEFDARVSKADFSKAVYADGTPANKVDVLSRFRFEYHDEDGDGRSYYRLIGPGGKPLRMKDGRLFNLRVVR
jgi:hypothetical protein